MEKRCSYCPEECWFEKTTQELALNHNNYARALGTDNAREKSELTDAEILLINDTENQIEMIREQIYDDCPNINVFPDYIGRWFLY